MKRLGTFIFVFLMLNYVFAQKKPFTFEHKGKTQDIEARMKMRKVNGMNMQIYHNGKLDTTILKGYADRTHKAKVTEHTLFQVGMMSSAVGNFLVLKAVSAGKIALEKNVNDYLQSWKIPAPNNEIITVSDLLMHIPNFNLRDKTRGYKMDAKVPTLLQILKGEKPAHHKEIKLLANQNPFSFDQYAAPLILQQLLEDTYKMPFAQIAAQELFQPLGMTESTFEMNLSAEQQKLAAVGYRHSGRKLYKNYRNHPDAIASGLWTTPNDYAKFVFHVFAAAKGEDNSLINKDLAMKCVLAQNNKDRSYLFGVGDKYHFYLGGASYGYRTQFEANFETGNLVAIFLNSHENWQFLNIDCLNVANDYLKAKDKK